MFRGLEEWGPGLEQVELEVEDFPLEEITEFEEGEAQLDGDVGRIRRFRIVRGVRFLQLQEIFLILVFLILGNENKNKLGKALLSAIHAKQ